MGATGLFLCIFLIEHLAGNLLLLLPASKAQYLFNKYADFMSNNILVRVIEVFLFLSIIFHAVMGIYLEINNRKKRAVGYSMVNYRESGVVISRYMAPLGVLIFVFLVIHLKNFWWEYNFGELGRDPHGYRDLYTLCMVVFQKWWYVLIYVLSMVFLGMHLSHGALSQFISLGIYHKGWYSFMERFRYWFAWIISGGFAIIPLWIYIRDVVIGG